MQTKRRITQGLAAGAALGLLLAAGGGAIAETRDGRVQRASLTVSTTSIKGQAGNKLIILVKGDDTAGRLCVTIPSDDYSLPATAMTEPPVPWDPCGPETPRAVLGSGTAYVRAMVNVPDTRDALALHQEPIELSGDTTVQLDGSKLSANDDAE